MASLTVRRDISYSLPTVISPVTFDIQGSTDEIGVCKSRSIEIVSKKDAEGYVHVGVLLGESKNPIDILRKQK